MPLISIVAPFFNESAAVAIFHERLSEVCSKVGNFSFEFVCVNDGSSDATLALLKDLAKSDPRVRVVDLSRNFGKEAALTAGLDFARGDAVVPIDADLQDPPELIPLMIDRWQAGYEVVLARRSDRTSDSLPKRLSANLFYKIQQSIGAIRVPANVGDFRLMDRRVVEALKLLPERCRFMKGIFAWVGYRTTTIDYVRPPRAAGETKFSGWRLWNFALEGVTSFSTAPLRFWTYLGVATAGIAFLYGLFIILRTLIHGVDLPGYASLLVAVLFFGGVQLIGIGVLGEYIGRIYLETKQRPVYIVRDFIGPSDGT